MKTLTSAILSVLLVIFMCGKSIAQSDFNVPKNLELKVAEDYARLEPSIVNAAKWLEETDLDKQIGKRTQVNGFVIQWITGSPSVEITIDDMVMKLTKDNEQLLSIYMASYSAFMIQNKGADKKQAIKAAVNSILNVYKKGIAVKKNKELQKLSKMDSAELEKYISDKTK